MSNSPRSSRIIHRNQMVSGLLLSKIFSPTSIPLPGDPIPVLPPYVLESAARVHQKYYWLEFVTGGFASEGKDSLKDPWLSEQIALTDGTAYYNKT